ncbi:co-chaperone GroES [Blastopirellula marina]|uniref:Co-chaperonin GroES n=2 Tax=Pirellulaceae TaxID=2691357 RepID=A0A2S8FXU0_9BACT|nr:MULTISPECIES: co-chaperone GroES [Pirellulaceae]PQO36988.1 co-chaperone GroES [Blastopirellula marina]QDU73236.1 10 kDa chaperonin [Bremerella volcania]RCS53703.1 co-chaperone GroES [Bremerella cremea]
MKVVPLGANVVVRRMESEETTAGGIVLPGSAQEKPKQGRVLSVGDGHVLKDGTKAPLSVKEGDQVIFSSWAGTEIKVEGEELLIMAESDILAVRG